MKVISQKKRDGSTTFDTKISVSKQFIVKYFNDEEESDWLINIIEGRIIYINTFNKLSESEIFSHVIDILDQYLKYAGEFIFKRLEKAGHKFDKADYKEIIESYKKDLE